MADHNNTEEITEEEIPKNIILYNDVLHHLEKDLLNPVRFAVLNEDVCRKQYQRLLSLLPCPPLYTSVRLNIYREQPENILKILKEQLSENHKDRITKLPDPFIHPAMPDVAIIPNVGPVEGIEKLPSEVMVDHSCGMSVLRGSEVFVKGVLAAPLGMARGDNVSLYADIYGRCLRGQTRPVQGKKLFLGNGIATVSRDEIYRHNNNPMLSTVLSGVGISMTNGLYSAPRLDNLNQDLLFAQNLPSAVCSYVLNPQPNDIVLDMCAAPGGKTIHIATLMKNQGRVVALDRTLPKVQRVSSLASRWGLSCVETFPFDSIKAVQDSAEISEGPPYPPETFDRILLDAPCSALGQRPTYRNKVTLPTLKSYPTYQRKLFRKAVELLKPGGILVYSTCTITLAENENQVAWALDTFSDLALCPQKPHIGGTGLPGSLLSHHQQKLVQRFDPSVQNDTKTEFDRDTIGFFIAKFKRTINTN